YSSDLDHTRPHHHGGPTTDANLAALHRRHHKIKALPGTHVTQPRPGTLLWRTRTGDCYLVTPDEF
ncbi:HNH endonuclease, partial [Planotetraspora sp. GP83]|uniref:HNH endonuclease n=1 Tax=Planotetraspora sp. GP83 TaxID=3156264 RepID=UPI0035172F37